MKSECKKMGYVACFLCGGSIKFKVKIHMAYIFMRLFLHYQTSGNDFASLIKYTFKALMLQIIIILD